MNNSELLTSPHPKSVPYPQYQGQEVEYRISSLLLSLPFAGVQTGVIHTHSGLASRGGSSATRSTNLSVTHVNSRVSQSPVQCADKAQSGMQREADRHNLIARRRRAILRAFCKLLMGPRSGAHLFTLILLVDATCRATHLPW